MVKQNKNEMLNVNGGGIIRGIGMVVSLFGRIIYRSLFRW